MATTTRMAIQSNAWTLISTALNGTIENQTGEDIYIKFTNMLPSPSDTTGHVLVSTESVQFGIDSGSTYARIISPENLTGYVVLTV